MSITKPAKIQMHTKYRCSDNQAEQLAIVKVFEVIEMQQVKNKEPGTAVIYRDSKITLN
jgi:hypothetical protein